MDNKGFADTNNIVETPNGGDNAGKPLKSNPVTPNRVDINVLKARVQLQQGLHRSRVKLALWTSALFLMEVGEAAV